MFGDERLPKRFWSKASVSGDTGCWVWKACRNWDGYGMFGANKWGTIAHRVAYLALVGEIPSGKELDHLCRNRACVNPQHLEPVTRQTNVLRGEANAAQNARKTHCEHGHELNDENVYLNWSNRSTPRRVCKLCRRRIDLLRRPPGTVRKRRAA